MSADTEAAALIDRWQQAYTAANGVEPPSNMLKYGGGWYTFRFTYKKYRAKHVEAMINRLQRMRLHGVKADD